MSEPEVSSNLDKKVYSEQIKLLYSCSRYRPALHIIAAIVVVVIVMDSVPLTYITTWILTLVIFNIYRILDISNTQSNLDGIDDFRPLQKHFVLLAASLGLIYGLSITFIFTQLTLIEQIYILCLVTTLVPAGIVSFASDKTTFYAYFYGIIK